MQVYRRKTFLYNTIPGYVGTHFIEIKKFRSIHIRLDFQHRFNKITITQQFTFFLKFNAI
jgi:hypothetical protein